MVVKKQSLKKNLNSRFVKGRGLPPRKRGEIATGVAISSGASKMLTPSLASSLPIKEDPIFPSEKIRRELLQGLKELVEDRNWQQIWDRLRTKIKIGRLITEYQIRINKADSHSLTDIKKWTRDAFNHYGGSLYKPAKVQIFLSYLLYDRDNEEYRFFYSSENTSVFNSGTSSSSSSRIIRNMSQLNELLNNLELEDTIEQLKMENDEIGYRWVFSGFTSATIRITNVSRMTVYKSAGPCHFIPKSILHHKGLAHFANSAAHDFRYRDLCGFRAIYYALNQTSPELKKLTRWKLHSKVGYEGERLAREFAAKEGVGEPYPISMDDLERVEEFLNVRIFVWEIESGTEETKFVSEGGRKRLRTELHRGQNHFRAKCIRRTSRFVSDKEIHLCAIQNHLSAIRNIAQFAQAFYCDECNRKFKDYSRLSRHMKEVQNCNEKIVQSMKSNWYNINISLDDELKAWGFLKKDEKIHEYYGAWDSETYLKKYQNLRGGKKLRYHAQMHLACIAYQTNIPGMKKVRIAMDLKNPEKLVRKFVDFVEKASLKAQRLYHKAYDNLIIELTKASNNAKTLDYYNPFQSMLQRLKKRFKQFKMFGFFSSRFDVPLTSIYRCMTLTSSYD